MKHQFNLKVIADYNKVIAALGSGIFFYIHQFQSGPPKLKFAGMLFAIICVGASIFVLMPLTRIVEDSVLFDSWKQASQKMIFLSYALWIEWTSFLLAVIAAGILGLIA